MKVSAPWFAETEEVLPRFGIDTLSGEEFEHLVSELLRLTGFDATVVGGSGDLGADIIADTGDERISVQVKRYGPQKVVSRRAVSDAVAAKAHYDCDSAMVVTNREFSLQVAEFAEGRCYLVDRTLLAPWLEEFSNELWEYLGGWDVDRMSGERFEGAVADLLRSRGYVVNEVGGTGDYGADLVAEREDRRWTVQVKRKKGPVSRRAVSDAVAARDFYDCTHSMVVTNNPEFSSGAEQLAEDSGCWLIGRETLTEWMAEYERPDSESSDSSDSSFQSPDRFLHDIDWYRQLQLAELGPMEVGEPDISFSLFRTSVKQVRAPVTISYSGIPEGSWLGLKLPNHSQFTWERRGAGERKGASIWLIPLRQKSGQIAFTLTVDPPGSSANPAKTLERVSHIVEGMFRQDIEGFLHYKKPSNETIKRSLGGARLD